MSKMAIDPKDKDFPWIPHTSCWAGILYGAKRKYNYNVVLGLKGTISLYPNFVEENTLHFSGSPEKLHLILADLRALDGRLMEVMLFKDIMNRHGYTTLHI